MLYNAEHYPDPTACDAMKNIQQSLPLQYTINGEPRTKKNSQRIFYRKGQVPFIAPSKAYKEYERQALWQLRPRPRQPIQKPVAVKCVFYMKTKRKVDLVNLLEAVCDILVTGNILADDNSSIVVSHDGSRVLYDKNNPRAEIIITETDNQGV